MASAPRSAARRHLAALDRLRADTGDTLIELLVTIVIIGIAATGILGGLAAAVTASGHHQGIAAVDSVLKSYSENATYQVELASSPLYADCAVPSSYLAHITWSFPAGYSTGYSATISEVDSWNMTSNQWTVDSGACTSAMKSGVQRLTIGATGPTGVSDSLQIVVRNPSFVNGYDGF